MEQNSESQNESDKGTPQGFVVEIKPVIEDTGTFVHREGDETTMQLAMSDRPDLVRNFGAFMHQVASQHGAIKLGCLECGAEMYASGNVPKTEHEFTKDDCPKCGGKLINLDYDID